MRGKTLVIGIMVFASGLFASLSAQANDFWDYQRTIRNVTLWMNDYSSTSAGSLYITSDQGESWTYVHNEEPAKLEIAKMFMATALSAQANGYKVYAIGYTNNGTKYLRNLSIRKE